MTDHNQLGQTWYRALNLDERRRLLGPEESSFRAATPPDWLAELDAAYGEAAASSAGILEEPVAEGASAGFLSLAAPLVERARHRLLVALEELLARHPSAPATDASALLDLLFAPLPGRLYGIVRRTLTLELNASRVRGELVGETGEDRYRHFLERLRDPAVARSILAEYPVLARLLVQALGRWERFALELVGHLFEDWEEVRENLADGRDPGPLVEIQGEAGDSHRGGRSVQILRFAAGLRVVYKPRSLAVDRHFEELVRWFDRRRQGPSLRTPRVLDRGDRGWVEFVESTPCRSREEVDRFYQRTGALLALVYAVEGTDFHYENLIASGEHPVLVDLESLFQQRLAQFDPSSASGTAVTSVSYSVIRTGLLPRRIRSDEDGEGVDLSGMGGKDGQLSLYATARFEDTGSDRMRLVLARTALQGTKNRPRLGDQAVDLGEHAGALLQGFADGYRTLARHRSALLAADGPIARFRDDEVRVILRPTRLYALLLADSFHPDHLRDAVDRERHFDKLWVAARRWSELAEAIPSEQAQLRAGDIPIFLGRPGSTELEGGDGQRLAGLVAERGLDLVERRIRDLGEDDLRLQSWLVRASLATLDPAAAKPRPKSYRSASQPPQPERLVGLARGMGARLQELALRGSDGGVTWIGLAGEDDRYIAPRAAGFDLYDGLPGIALFLARLGSLTGEEAFTDLARGAWHTVRTELERSDAELAVVGAFNGWGALSFAALCLGSWLDDAQLLREAEEHARRIPDLLDRHPTFDVIGGAAGAAAVLLALHEVVPSPWVLRAARSCGDQLLATAHPMADGIGWSPEPSRQPPLAGFSHGAAGIAWALAALYRATGDGRYLEAAEGAMAYERTLFVPRRRNWRDLRSFAGADQRFIAAWCHGASGIGLARLAMLPILEAAGERPDVRAEIVAAVEGTLVRGFGGGHSLCHGDLGNLELLTAAARAIEERSWTGKAAGFAGAIVADIETNGPRCGVPEGLETPGLMTGLAGIGYGLLRLAAPAEVPSVLLLEPPVRPAGAGRVAPVVASEGHQTQLPGQLRGEDPLAVA